ncbi:dihydroneopterin aldolase [Bradyrhizobium sp. CCBAU 21362]|uniref:dihydroneopterin aldolase n=1 Tax=Bradyrhizobium sp. CCBAU 21362 TaxID=1325082 RepID=UPI00230679ED|nr:dihydroneopterin aldolase [Bradyrhizobium sp. CCBAU 21362]
MQRANHIAWTADASSKSYIVIADLEVECIIGIYPHERVTPQKLLFDVRLDLDIGEAAAVDSIGSTTDYDDIAQIVSSCAMNGRYQLVETCVTNIVD